MTRTERNGPIYATNSSYTACPPYSPSWPAASPYGLSYSYASGSYTEEHRALADAIQEQMIYRALCHEATMRGKWIGQ